jgi:hypothetical protein
MTAIAAAERSGESQQAVALLTTHVPVQVLLPSLQMPVKVAPEAVGIPAHSATNSIAALVLNQLQTLECWSVNAP